MRQHAEDLTSRDRATNPHPVIVAGAPSAPCDDYDADIVILALDRADETIAAIRSALSQTGVSRHVFIVDQGSKPANLALSAAEVADRPDATLVALDRNYGVAGGRNRGSALGHGRIIFGLDNDAEFAEPDHAREGGRYARRRHHARRHRLPHRAAQQWRGRHVVLGLSTRPAGPLGRQLRCHHLCRCRPRHPPHRLASLQRL